MGGRPGDLEGGFWRRTAIERGRVPFASKSVLHRLKGPIEAVMICRRFLQFSPLRHLALLTVAGLGIAFVGLAACSGTTERTPENAFQKPTESPSGLLIRLVEDEWRLFSGAFGSQARDGHGIGFTLDGYVEHNERRLGDVWTLEGTSVDECSLSVFPSVPSSSEVTLTFTYDNEQDAFLFEAGLAHMVLAPRGFDFAGYLEWRRSAPTLMAE